MGPVRRALIAARRIALAAAVAGFAAAAGCAAVEPPPAPVPVAIARFPAVSIARLESGEAGPLRVRAVAEDGGVFEFVEGGRPPWRENPGDALPPPGFPLVFVELKDLDPWRKPLLATVGMDMGRVAEDGTIRSGAKLRLKELEKAVFVGVRRNPTSFDFFVFRPPAEGRAVEYEEAKLRRDRSVQAPLPARAPLPP